MDKYAVGALERAVVSVVWVVDVVGCERWPQSKGWCTVAIDVPDPRFVVVDCQVENLVNVFKESRVEPIQARLEDFH